MPNFEVLDARIASALDKYINNSHFKRRISYEPNFVTFGELNDSSLLFHDPVIGPRHGWRGTRKLFTEAHRGQADYCNSERVSVSQSSLSVVFDGTGKPLGERYVDQSIGFGVTRNTYSAHSNFLKTLELRNWSMDQGNLMSRDRWLSRKVAEKSVITNSKQLEPKKNAEFYKKNYGESNWNFVKFINKVLQRRELRKFESSTFDTIARRKFIEDQITIVELSGRVQELQNEVNCSNDSQDFSTCGISSQWKVPRYQSTSVFPTSSGTWRDVEAFFRIAAPQRKAAKHLGHTWFFGKRSCKSRCIFISSFISRIESNAICPSRSCSMYLQRRKVEDQNEIKIRDASLDRQLKIQSSLVEETLQRIMEAAIDTYLLEDKIQDRGMY